VITSLIALALLVWLAAEVVTRKRARNMKGASSGINFELRAGLLGEDETDT